MPTMLDIIIGFLALTWGIVYALFLQFTKMGEFLAKQRTWLSVVIGVGVLTLMFLAVCPLVYWLRWIVLLGLGGFGIIGRSVYNEYSDLQKALENVGEG